METPYPIIMRFAALWLSVICIAVFVLQAILGTEHFLLVNSLKWSEPWRLLTSIFAHSSPAHLLSNIFALSLFGLILEGRIGSRMFLWFFIISGIVVNIFSLYERSLGASGAIYAVIGALAVLRPAMVVWVQWLPMPMVVAALMWLFQDILGVFYPSGVANAAHISGLFLGAGAGVAWRKKFGDRISFGKKSTKDPILERQLDDWERRNNLRK